MTNHLFDGLLEKGRAAPERRFALMPDGRTYSYRDVEEVSARFASTLVALGLKPGDVVTLHIAAIDTDKASGGNRGVSEEIVLLYVSEESIKTHIRSDSKFFKSNDICDI